MLVRTSFAILLSAGVFGSLGCGDDDENMGGSFGAPCRVDADCERGRCAKGENYPGGMCTMKCLSDGDCIPGTLCVVDEGGICALSCGGGDGDCIRFSTEYRCDDIGHKGSTGVSLVCRKP